MPTLRLPALSRTTILLATLTAIAILTSSTGMYFWLQNQQFRHANQQQTTDHQLALEQTNQSTVELHSLHSQIAQLEQQRAAIQSTASADQWQPLQAIFDAYRQVQTKVDRNNLQKLDTTSITDSYAAWGSLLLGQKYDELNKALATAQSNLDQQYQQYQASLSQPTAPKPTANSGGSGGSGATTPAGFSSQNVNTSRGVFAVKMVKLPLSQYNVKTVTAAATSCTTNCPAKSLAQYVSENGAYAGINGSYFCPPDYASCSSKINSFDFAVFNSNNGSWHNPNARTWDSIGMITFTGSTAQAYKTGASYPGHAVTAAISNFPPLILFNGQINSDENSQSLAQKSRNYKGSLGVNGSDIFLVTATGVSITDLATVMKTLGATHALNLDGGGSGALYINGAYKTGPGRLLPNAIVLVKK